jgi:hypothetical protein
MFQKVFFNLLYSIINLIVLVCLINYFHKLYNLYYGLSLGFLYYLIILMNWINLDLFSKNKKR